MRSISKIWFVIGSAAALCAQTAPVFEVAAIHPLPEGARGALWVIPSGGGRVRIQAATLQDLVGLAYGVLPSQVAGGPGWAASTRFDINAIATTAPRSTAEFARDNPQRVEALLKEHFHLAVHREGRVQRRYALTLARQDKLGPGLNSANETTCDEVDITTAALPDVTQGLPSWCGNLFAYQGRAHGSKMSLASFAEQLGRILRIPVVDQTGLAGPYDLDYDYSPAAQKALESSTPTPIDGKTLFDALEDQLGLKLEPRTGPVEFVVIDHADRPDAN